MTEDGFFFMLLGKQCLFDMDLSRAWWAQMGAARHRSRILASKELPNFPQDLVIECLAASDDEEYLASGSFTEDFDHCRESTLNLSQVEYIELRIRQRSEQLLESIANLEVKLEDCDDEQDMENITNQLSELYELEEDMKEKSQREMHNAIGELGLDRHANKSLSKLSSGWRYKCRLVSAFLSHPEILIIDEPSFLDEASTKWFITRVLEASMIKTFVTPSDQRKHRNLLDMV